MVVVKVEGYRGELPVGVNLADRNSFERPKSHEFVRLLSRGNTTSTLN